MMNDKNNAFLIETSIFSGWIESRVEGIEIPDWVTLKVKFIVYGKWNQWTEVKSWTRPFTSPLMNLGGLVSISSPLHLQINS